MIANDIQCRIHRQQALQAVDWVYKMGVLYYQTLANATPKMRRFGLMCKTQALVDYDRIMSGRKRLPF